MAASGGQSRVVTEPKRDRGGKAPTINPNLKAKPPLDGDRAGRQGVPKRGDGLCFLSHTGDEESVGAVFVGEERHHAAL
jgi:hypothetical protein